MDGAYGPSVGRFALRPDEDSSTYNAAKGSTMRELLRVRRRASRFGGPDRETGSPHAQKHFGLERVEGLHGTRSHSTGVDQNDSALLHELMRRSAKAPGDAVGAWPRSPACHRPGESGDVSPSRFTVDSTHAEEERPSSAAGPPIDDAAKPSTAGAAVMATVGPRDDGEHLRYQHSTTASTNKQSHRRRPPGYDTPDANLEPVERLINALTPKHLHPAPIESAKKLRYRLTAAEALMGKCQEELATEIARRAARFGDEMMGDLAKDMIEGLTTEDMNEMRSLSRNESPQPVWGLLGRCVATVLSTDNAGEAERRVVTYGLRPANNKMTLPGGGEKRRPEQNAAPSQTGDRRKLGAGVSGSGATSDGLLTWEAAQRVIVRADFKTRVRDFDVRCLLTYPLVVAAVQSRIDVTVSPGRSMHSSVRLRDASGRRKDQHQIDTKRKEAAALRAIGLGPRPKVSAAPTAAATSADGDELETALTGGGDVDDCTAPRYDRIYSLYSRVRPRQWKQPPDHGYQGGGGVSSPPIRCAGGGGGGGAIGSGGRLMDTGISMKSNCGAGPRAGLTGHGGAGGSYGYGFTLNSGDAVVSGVGEGGGDLARLTIEDAKHVSHSATAFLVWLSRLFSVIDSLKDEWYAATNACKEAELRIDSARNQCETLRAKLLVAEREEAARLEDLSAQESSKVELRRLTARFPTELTTSDLLIIPHRGQVNEMLGTQRSLFSLACFNTP